MTLTLKIASQFLCMTHRLRTMDHHIRFGSKRLSCSDDIFWIDFLYYSFFIVFFTEFSLLVDHHKPKHTLKMCYCCVKGQGHSNGWKIQFNVCLDGTFWTTETLVTELGTVVHDHESQSPKVLWKVCFAVVKVRVTAKVQNVTDCLPRWYLLNDLIFCSQT